MCIDLDSDIIIEEGDTDLKSRCLIVKGERIETEDEGAQADEKQSKEGIEVAQEQREETASQTAEQKMEDLDETILSTLTQDFDREVVEKEFVNLAQHYQHILDSYAKLVNEVPHVKKWQLATHMATMPVLPLVKVTTKEKVSSMYRQKYSISESSTTGVSEEFNLKVYRTTDDEKVQSVWNTVGDCSMLLLLAIGDCVINRRSQAETAKKYGIPKSRVQWAMSGKKEHKKGSKQYRQEKKHKLSEEENPASSKKAKKDEQGTEVLQAPVAKQEEPEKGGEEKESSSDKLPDMQL